MRGWKHTGIGCLVICLWAVSLRADTSDKVAAPDTALQPGITESTAKMLAEALRTAHAPPAALVRAKIDTDTPVVLAGREVWVRFTITNLTGQLVTLRVPEVDHAATGEPSMGLPLAHVFSGEKFSSLTILDRHGDMFGRDVTLPPRAEVPEIQLAPRATVGMTVELTQYYPILRGSGIYTLTWRPYDGQVSSEPLLLTILAEQEAIVLTDFGRMRMRFHYDVAPLHVANFVELVNMRFYDRLTFNRVVPGGLIQGGDPQGDRRGIRPDGKRVPAEFSDIPFERGTVGMARSMHDPDSASAQFFITLARQPSFDGRQTAFAYLVGEESLRTLDKIAAVPTDANSRPTRPVYIQTISLENVPSEGWRTQDGRDAGTRDRLPATRPAPALGPPVSEAVPSEPVEQPPARERP